MTSDTTQLASLVDHAQKRASDARTSAWVSANAGSGKTYVLTQRVIRLLLQGVAPKAILCLTFTKAAATNMSLRIFKILSDWVAFDDEKLSQALIKIGHSNPHTSDLARARRLFAHAVETPGGLKIQTIHAFCERLLHMFPLEAGVPQRFNVMEPAQQKQWLVHACTDVFSLTQTDEHPELNAALSQLHHIISEHSFHELLIEALSYRQDILAQLAQDPSGDLYAQMLKHRLSLPPHDTLARTTIEILTQGDILQQVISLTERLDKGGKSDQAIARNLREIHVRLKNPDEDVIEAYFDIFFTQKREPRGQGARKFISKSLEAQDPTLLTLLENEQDRLHQLLHRRRSLHLVERTQALLCLMYHILRKYEDEKHQHGLLDFDDLITRTLGLLQETDAAWVLYKLDAGIDHILVDEAQDTSPAQWDILTLLSEEFLSGLSARETPRTFFAVGDEKQSIYSFHGAAPHMFDERRRYFQQSHQYVEKSFEYVNLNTSFRSSPHLLASIDRIFSNLENRRGLTADHEAPIHEAWKTHLPGKVEIWDPVRPNEAEDPADWRLPLDTQLPHDPPVVLANRLADMIKGWLDPNSTERVHDAYGQPRPVEPADILILVRSRNSFFNAMIKALKRVGAPVAGADRLILSDHIAVMDLLALGQICLVPEDDLALACVLKSPLFNLDDDDLITLAPLRTSSLWAALEGSDNPIYTNIARKLNAWHHLALTLAPFEFYAHILSVEGGRQAFLSRLGGEASEALDELLRQALESERQAPPSLPLFLAQFEEKKLEIRRDMDAGAQTIRVMTVHGAKGLEAKIVILADTCSKESGQHDPGLFILPTEKEHALLAWAGRSAEDPPLLAQTRLITRQKEEEEHRRLLYVALTRAEEQLYIAGFHGSREPPPGCWYHRIRNALEDQLIPHPAQWDPETQIHVVDPKRTVPK